MEEDYYSQQTQTQQQTQATQSQSSQSQFPSNLWGILVSCSPASETTAKDPLYLPRPDQFLLHNRSNEYTVGRSPACSIVLAGKKVSITHCRIFLSPEDGLPRLEDKSTNGTYVRGSKVGKDKVTTLEDGNEIIFGQGTKEFSHDFRYIFRSATANVCEIIQTPLSAYEVKESIGKGSFATVYRGIQRSTGTMVAIKKIQLARFSDQPDTMRMLKREVQIMRTLRHEYCVKLLDYYEDDKFMYLIQEFMAGGDLLGYIMDKNGLSERVTKKIAWMAISALDYMKNQGVAHRDIKPENILLTGKIDPIIKLTDFGLAKLAIAGTELRTQCGTPTYLAPEVVGEDGFYGFAVDAYSIGVVLYSCLANATPFNEDSKVPLAERMKARVVDSGELRDLKISENGIDLISRLLIANPQERITVEDALLHSWFQEEITTITVPITPQLTETNISSTTAIVCEASFGYSGLRLDSPIIDSTATITRVEVEGEGNQSTETEKASEADIGATLTKFSKVSPPPPPSPEPMDTVTTSGLKRKQASSAFSSDSSLDRDDSPSVEPSDQFDSPPIYSPPIYSPSITSTENDDIKFDSPEIPTPSRLRKKTPVSGEKRKQRSPVVVPKSDRVTRSKKVQKLK